MMISDIITKENIVLVKDAIESNNKFIITAHISPDGDAMGSSLGLYHFIKDKGKEVTIIFNDQYPAHLGWLDGSDKILIFEEEKIKSEKLISEADVIFCCDFNASYRMGALCNPVIESPAKKIMIDHHLDPEPFCDITISHSGYSSTCELVFRLIWQLGEIKMLSLSGAEALYTGIMTDTGAFAYNSNSPELFIVVSELLKIGVNKDQIYDKVFNNNSENRERLLGYAMYKKMKLFKEYKASMISLDKDELIHFNYKKGDSEGLVNKPLSIENIVCSVYFREDPEYIKVSLRSKGDFPVNIMAEKYFGGGGHKNAAGGEFKGTLKEAEQLFEAVLPVFIKYLQF